MHNSSRNPTTFAVRVRKSVPAEWIPCPEQTSFSPFYFHGQETRRVIVLGHWSPADQEIGRGSNISRSVVSLLCSLTSPPPGRERVVWDARPSLPGDSAM
ncbi:hypothetical protein RRG08_065608 [Elysia crispata]|uniref:Uncharacterized protein n=1 Tax=Elysia crispata TaxID=231223 RepID=A0AAE1D1J7_9GAST|nr:hypothetical protein RRG08_065608 [Elysia crispata]